MINSKWAHIIVFLVVVVATISLILKFPELYKDMPAKLSMLSGMATFYGMFFAIIEVMRTKGVAESANKEAKAASLAISQIYSIKDMSSCQSAVELALDSLDRNEQISASVLSVIVKIYSEVFHQELDDHNSEYRHARSLLHSYVFAATDKKSGIGSNKQKLKESLLIIMGHLGMKMGKNTQIGDSI